MLIFALSKSNDWLANLKLALWIFQWCPYEDSLDTIRIIENEDKWFLLQIITSVHHVRGMQSPVLTIGLHLCISQCNNDYVPVCGSNGESYQNECYLRQAACKQQSEILVVSEGSCATGMCVIFFETFCLDSKSKNYVFHFLLYHLPINNSDYILTRQACIVLFKAFIILILCHFYISSHFWKKEGIYHKDSGRFKDICY